MSNFSVNLGGKTAIVTGAGSGIGRATALALASAGAAVFINDVNPDSIDDVSDEIAPLGGTHGSYHGDIANRFQASALIERARAVVGARIDIFVNAAGVYRADTIDRLDEWDWRRMLDVNLSSAFFSTQLVGRVMADFGGGCIVNLTSIHALEKQLGVGVAYAASKAGLIGLTRQAARELFAYGIRVHAVGRGLGRFQNTGATVPADLSRAILFLCSPRAAHLTGHIVNLP